MPKQSPQPAFLDTARAFYAEAIEHKKKRDLARSIADWSAMEEGEQSFAVAHLLYLNRQAQAAGQRIVTQVRELLDEVAESLTTAIEATLPDEEEESAPPDDDLADEDDQDPEGFPVEAPMPDVGEHPAEVVTPDGTDGDDADPQVAA
jgi:hypothetical protein